MSITTKIQNLASNVKIAVQDRLAGKPEAGKRSSEWPRVRKDHLAIQPKCQWCGASDHPEVHHMMPFHDNPALELDQANLITLCEGGGKECHLQIGHDGNFHLYNPDVASDCKRHAKPDATKARANEPGD